MTTSDAASALNCVDALGSILADLNHSGWGSHTAAVGKHVRKLWAGSDKQAGLVTHVDKLAYGHFHVVRAAVAKGIASRESYAFFKAVAVPSKAVLRCAPNSRRW